MVSILSARYEYDYKILLEFDSGESGIVDLSDVIQKYKVAEPLKDIEEFKRFYLDEWPTLAWKCGFDLAPESLYERATGKKYVWLNEP